MLVDGAPLPADFHQVVAANRRFTAGIIVAARPPCTEARDWERVAVSGRDIRILPVTGLTGLELPARWLMAVLVCDGDSTIEIAAWAMRSAKEKLHRIIFYVEPEVDVDAAFGGWKATGRLQFESYDYVGAQAFHKMFGMKLAWRIYDDVHGLP